MVWRFEDKLKYPIKGYLLAKKRGFDFSITGGTALDKVNIQEDNTYLVGTEGGGIFKCSVIQASEGDISGLFTDNQAVRWKPEALSVLENLPKKSLMEVKKRVERYVQDKGERDIWAPTVFAAKPDIKLLYPIPFNSTYEKHMGPVKAIACSPFQKRIFLSCSSDGAVRMYDVIETRPIAVFEPGYTEYLMAVAWSPFRPTVFAAVSNNGTVYIYDLILSKQVPSYVL